MIKVFPLEEGKYTGCVSCSDNKAIKRIIIKTDNEFNSSFSFSLCRKCLHDFAKELESD